MTKKVTVSKRATENDYYSDSSREFLSLMKQCRVAYDKKKMSNKVAYARVTTYVNGKIVEEREAAQKAAVGVAILAGAAAIAVCSQNGGCSGSGFGGNDNYSKPYPGNCQYEWDIAADGSRCGKRAASYRPGGYFSHSVALK